MLFRSQTPEQEKFFRESIYGGRTYKYQHKFVSSQREGSRRIMLRYLQKTNPYFNSTELEQQLENSPYYTDTDCIQIQQRQLKYFPLKKEIGGISDDLVWRLDCS